MAPKRGKRKAEVARAIVFGDATRSVGEILKEWDVSEAEYADWLTDAEFLGEIESLTSYAAEAESARVMKALAELSKSGDVKVVRLYFDLLGERRKSVSDAVSPLEALKKEIWGGEL